MTARIDHAVTSGTFSLDGQTFEVDNNVWILGDDDECIVIDAPHDVAAIRDAIGGRTVRAVVCTHAHDDHVRYAHELGDAVSAPVLLN
ncbi:MAG: MBL fold metallo-hydrolase, partial [Pseudoclavibacter sp.]